MEQELMVKIPRDWMKGLPDEELTLKQIIRLGIHQYRMERALQLLRDNVGSLGYVAEQTGVDKQDLIKAARQRGIDPDFSLRTMEEELSGCR